MGRTFYSPDFEVLWRAYDAPPNSSKLKAYEAYKKAKDIPSDDMLLLCINAYNSWLKQQKGVSPYPKCHMATWINQARWEGFMDKAEQMQTIQAKVQESKEAMISASRQSWPKDIIEKLKLPDPVLEAWIIPCTYVSGPPPQIVAPKRMHANYLREKLIDRLERAIGPGVVISHVP
jgi:hypothetical protein